MAVQRYGSKLEGNALGGRTPLGITETTKAPFTPEMQSSARRARPSGSPGQCLRLGTQVIGQRGDVTAVLL